MPHLQKQADTQQDHWLNRCCIWGTKTNILATGVEQTGCLGKLPNLPMASQHQVISILKPATDLINNRPAPVSERPLLTTQKETAHLRGHRGG